MKKYLVAIITIIIIWIFAHQKSIASVICKNKISLEKNKDVNSYLINVGLEFESNIKSKNYKIDLGFAQIDHTLVFLFDFNEKLCFENETNLVFEFNDYRVLTFTTIDNNCEGVITFSVSHLLENESTTRIIEDEILSV